MCGIAGIFDRSRTLVTPGETIRRMTDCLSHRGPDMSGYWDAADMGVYFGHRRLSIIDLSSTGAQPMQSASGRYAICLNGEIYNFETLRKSEAICDYPFQGTSDTEVLLALIDRMGLCQTLDKISGMFAFAVWDRDEGRLSLVRDRVGEKPLYYFHHQHHFYFASELHSIVTSCRDDLRISSNELRSYLAKGYLPIGSSIFKGVKKVLPGHLVSIDAQGQLQQERYWELDLHKYSHVGSLNEADEILRSLLANAVEKQMIADVPIGAFLSGGIDSSLVVATMQDHSARSVKTFSVGFSDPRYDESSYAKRVAGLLGTDHHEIKISEDELVQLVPQALEKYDEPFADSSLIPTYFVMKYARQFVTVCLSGDGGDELFCGYSRYFKAVKLWSQSHRIPGPFRSLAASAVKSLLTASEPLACLVIGPENTERWNRYARAIQRNSFPYFYQTMTSTWQYWEPVMRDEFIDPSNSVGRDEDNDLFREMRLDDFYNYLPNDILVKLDRAAMAVSLETRIPLLDREIIEFAFSVDPSFHLSGFGSKNLLKRRLYDRLPAEIFERPKMGFAVPMSAWLRGPLKSWGEDLLADLESIDQLNAPLIRSYWQRHQSGNQDWQARLWNVLCLLAWKRNNGI